MFHSVGSNNNALKQVKGLENDGLFLVSPMLASDLRDARLRVTGLSGVPSREKENAMLTRSRKVRAPPLRTLGGELTAAPTEQYSSRTWR
jgi:hypothetical protein